MVFIVLRGRTVPDLKQKNDRIFECLIGLPTVAEISSFRLPSLPYGKT